ncbi:MAG: F0F1 ATP synthase subunit A [Oscillospiraceae bacterium]|nr:F0F1 ATP synthase subunit A [Oscillospiraceae bacterium]
MNLLSNLDAVEAVTTVAEAAGESGGLSVEGPLVVAEFTIFGFDFVITESITVQWVVLIGLGLLFFVLGRNLKTNPDSKRQALAEMVVGMFCGLVNDTMGKKYSKYTPYMAALFFWSLGLSLSCLLGFRPPTSDFSVVFAWGMITFILIHRNRFKTGGLGGGLKSFTEPIFIMTPMNLLSELITPVSQSLRHFGNILAGLVIGGIVYWALEIFIKVPILIPVPFSLYFDIFSAVIQAFVFMTLTMVYVAMADCGPEEAE